MPKTTPLQDHYEAIDASMMPFGEGVQVVAQCMEAELEYAAIRKTVALLDGSHRGLVKLTGGERLAFLHRLVSNDCNAMNPGEVRRAFVLTAKGRILADLLIIHFENETLLDCEIHTTPLVVEELNDLLFGEDVQIEELSDSHHRISLIGPNASEFLNWWKDDAPTDACHFQNDNEIHIWAPCDAFQRVVDRVEELGDVFKLRFIGWHAWNIARIEAGRAMFHIDFGPDNLPHEAGPIVLQEAVSFTKGCYRGQEIVARMQSLGHPSKQVVGFRIEGNALPIAGVPIRAPGGEDVIGAVTSTTLSPMLSATPIGLAMVKWGQHEEGTKLIIPAEGKNVESVVQPLPFVC